MDAVVEWVREAVEHRNWIPTNPHTRGDHPTRTSRSGQRGALRLRLARGGGRTAVVERYAKAPFGSVRANSPDLSGIAEIQITNPSGGIMGGDRLEREITV